MGKKFIYIKFCAIFVFLIIAGSYTKPSAGTFSGNHPFYHKPDSDHLIVFVHGLNGNPVDTWTYKNSESSFFWPEYLALEDSSFKKADLLSFGYESQCTPSINIRKISRELEAHIYKLIKEYNYQSLSFVAHSMGGLVVREFVLSSYNHLSSQISLKNIILLSTPNLGKGLATFADYFCPDIQIENLTPGKNSYINSINNRWKERFEQADSKKSFLLSSGYELVPIYGTGIIVKKDTAVKFARQTRALFKDHINIARPYSQKDELYVWVKQRLLSKTDDIKTNEKQEQRSIDIITQLQREFKATELEKMLNFVSIGNLDRALAFLSKYEAEYKNNKDVQVSKTAGIHFAIAQLNELKLNYREALSYYEKAINLISDKALYLSNAGLLLAKLGNYDKAIEYYERALQIDLKRFGEQHPEIALHWDNLGFAWYSKGNYGKAIECFEKTLQIDIRTFGQDHPRVALRFNNLGQTWYLSGDYDKAIEYYERALYIDMRTFGQDHPKVALRWNNIGGVWRAKGQYDKAIEYYKKALLNDLKNFGQDHPIVAIRWNNIGGVWGAKGQYDKAIEYYKKALHIELKAFGQDHPRVAIRWNNIGSALYLKGEYDKAIEYFIKSLHIELKVSGGEHPNVARVLNNLGLALHAKGDYDKAIEYYERALKIDLKTFGEEHPNVTRDWNNLGGVWQAKGEYKKAVAYFKKSQRASLKIFGEEHPDVARVLNNLGNVMFSKGEYKKARSYFEKALKIFKKAGLTNMVNLVEENLKSMNGYTL